ncbi:UDP-glycosyltransferase UGT5-like [Zophobas morio]|uniref:UDP-glycosyltransferase UGT5-like n=1 Tax=Zophobas morio TaxID=2755281 RepID=UPI003082BF98
MNIITLIVLTSFTYLTHSARILGVFPFIGKSHYFLGSALMRALAEQGHDVTVISPFGERTPPNGSYRDIVLVKTRETFERKLKVNMFDVGELNPLISLPFLMIMLSELGTLTLQEPPVQELIHSDEKFDAVIVEQFLIDDLKALASHFNAVQIVFSSTGSNLWIDSLVGNPSPPSYVPSAGLSYSSQMTFLQRVTNTLVYLLNVVMMHAYVYPNNEQTVQKYIPGAPHIEDFLYNASLVLLNSHHSFSQPVPHVPNMVEIGGFHIKPPKKLPQDLQTFLDGATEGAIYFSMGSNLRSVDLPTDKRDAILNAFAKLKQKVLWKWEDEELPNKPKNVEVGKWLPQQDVLAHPNVKLFVTHGGLLSTTETIYFGVPVLAIPIYGDQKMNAQLAVNDGYGLSLPYKEVNKETFAQNLDEVLNNPKYSNNAKAKSKLFHDRLKTPMETALYWIDYVIRHKGAPHLRVAALDLPWYKYHVLDVIGFVVLVAAIGGTVFYVLLTRMCPLLFKRLKNKVKTN